MSTNPGNSNCANALLVSMYFYQVFFMLMMLNILTMLMGRANHGNGNSAYPSVMGCIDSYLA